MQTLAQYWLEETQQQTTQIVSWSTGSSKHHLDPKNCPVLTQRCENENEDYIRNAFARYARYEHENWDTLFDEINENLCYKCSVETAMNELLKTRKHTTTYIVTADHPDYTRGESLHVSSSAAQRFRNVMNTNNIDVHETGTRPFALIKMDAQTAAIMGEYWWTQQSPPWVENTEQVMTALTLVGEHPSLVDTTTLFDKAKLIHQITT